MSGTEFYIPKGGTPDSRLRLANRIKNMICALSDEVAWSVRITKGRKRSPEQNSFLWGIVYPRFIEGAGLDGWDDQDLHEYLLGEHYGWVELEGMGRKKVKPVRGSSGMTASEFNEHLEWIQRFAAERGIYIPDPNED